MNAGLVVAESAVADLRPAVNATAFELASISRIAADSTANNRQCPKVRYTAANTSRRKFETSGVATDGAVIDRRSAGKNTRAPTGKSCC